MHSHLQRSVGTQRTDAHAVYQALQDPMLLVDNGIAQDLNHAEDIPAGGKKLALDLTVSPFNPRGGGLAHK